MSIIEKMCSTSGKLMEVVHRLDYEGMYMRKSWGRLGRFLRADKVKCRYEVYRVEEDLGRVTSFCPERVRLVVAF